MHPGDPVGSVINLHDLRACSQAQAEATLDPQAGLPAAEDTTSDGAAVQRCDSPSAKASYGDSRAPAAKRRRDEAQEGSGGTADDVDHDGQDAHWAKRPRFWQQQQYTQVRKRHHIVLCQSSRLLTQ